MTSSRKPGLVRMLAMYPYIRAACHPVGEPGLEERDSGIRYRPDRGAVWSAPGGEGFGKDRPCCRLDQRLRSQRRVVAVLAPQ